MIRRLVIRRLVWIALFPSILLRTKRACQLEDGQVTSVELRPGKAAETTTFAVDIITQVWRGE